MGFFSKKKEEEFFDLLESNTEQLSAADEKIMHNFAAHALTPDEINRQDEEEKPQAASKSALDSLKNRMLNIEPEKEEKQEAKQEEKQETKKENNSLFDRCLPYVTDENGKVVKDETYNYSLDTFSDEKADEASRILDMLYKKYNIKFEDMTDNTAAAQEANQETEEKEQKAEDKTAVFPMVSDIDDETTLKPSSDEISKTGTIRFTPVMNDESEDIMSISSQTRPIDLTGELVGVPAQEEISSEAQTKIYENEFDEYVPKEEYVNPNESRKLLIDLARKRRNRFLGMFSSVVLTLVFALLEIPSVYEVFSSNMQTLMIIALSFFGLTALSNFDMFAAVPKTFSKKANGDSIAVLAFLAVAVYTVVAFLREISPIEIVLMGMISLCFRSIGAFMKSSYMYSNLKQINNNIKKRSVKLIDDSAITFAMAKNAIEGDALIAAPQYAARIGGYMKYSTFGTFMQGKLPVISAVSLITGIVMGFVIGAYFSNMLYGFYTAAGIFCFACMPIIFLIDNLPLSTASKKLNRRGAMIAGKAGAQAVEMANAIVLGSEDLFPFGTVTLHDIKVLSENNIDDTIIRAASLTDAIGSPLSNIFKKIAGTSSVSALPESDTIKYEDRMGISGWVDDKLLFIGNRTLLEAHGIAVPSVENDRKILKNGYFPVYVASGNTVCALLIIQYSVNPDVAHELRKLTASGVTILVNNTDPNLTEAMICDYLGLYEDSVKVMSAAGTHMYKTAIRPSEEVISPAVYKGNPIALATIINCAGRIKKSNILLTVIYAIAAIIGAVLFVYAPFSGGGSLLSGGFILLYNIITAVVSYLLYLTLKP